MLTLAARFGFERRERLSQTMDAIDRELGVGPFHYRYTGAEKEEGCFLACSFWMVEARVSLGQVERARTTFDVVMAGIGHAEILPEMIDPKSGEFLGNLPQGLSHLALVHAAAALR